MKGSFDSAFGIVVGEEGGYENDPADPGGETKYGISKQAHPTVDIPALTLEAAKAIYRRDYWDAVRADELPAGVDFMAFECAVNQGQVTAIRWLQQAAGVMADGKLGPQTMAVLLRGGAKLVAEFATVRALEYVRTGGFNRYGRGWFRRLFADVMVAAVAITNKGH